MLKSYKLDNENRICLTVKPGAAGLEQFDFPDGFDFSRQSFYFIINGVLTEDTELVREVLAAELRARRDGLLSKCDWTQTVDAPLDEETQGKWAVYRQALRDIPQQEGFPFAVVFPEEMQ